jgi:hypothetical protein
MLVTQRGHVVVNFFSFEKITEEVERTVENAFASRSHKEALALLNSHYIDMRLDFSEKFKSDLRPRDCIIEMIRCAFDGVPRGQGITLHEAEVLDDYGTEEDRENARRQDNEERWQDIPQKSLSLFTYWMYLDYEALRYYLPAVMISLLESAESGEYDNDASQSVLPLVDPRDVGRGHGEDFDVEGLIKKCAFTPKQVEAIYFFLINAAIEGGVGVEEDYYPAILKWRMQALGPA